MSLIFEKITDFQRGTLCALLTDAYSYDPRNGACWRHDWQVFDDFFYDRPGIADTCGFMTVLDGTAIGFVSWDPRLRPESVEIGHNCIACAHKGRGFGHLQMQEAVRRISLMDVKKIIVTTNAVLVPAQHTYESVGFKMLRRRKNEGPAAFAGDYIDYVYTK